MKSMLKTVLQMGSTDQNKVEQLKLAKLNALQLLAETKLKGAEITQILEQVLRDVIKPEAKLLEEKVEKSKAPDQDDNEDKISDGMKNFLEAIDLGDSEDEVQEQQGEDLNKKWSILFHGLSCLERLLEKQQDKKSIMVIL